MDALNSASLWLLSGSVVASVLLLLVVVLALALPVAAVGLAATLLEEARERRIRARTRDRHDADISPPGLPVRRRAAAPSRIRDDAAA